MLLKQYARDCVILEKEKEESDEGGYITVWNEGESFVAYMARESSAPTTRGEQEGYEASFNVLVDKAVGIRYGDYFRDKEGGGVFLVTTEPDMMQSPGSASFSLKNFSAKREDAP